MWSRTAGRPGLRNYLELYCWLLHCTALHCIDYKKRRAEPDCGAGRPPPRHHISSQPSEAALRTTVQHQCSAEQSPPVTAAPLLPLVPVQVFVVVIVLLFVLVVLSMFVVVVVSRKSKIIHISLSLNCSLLVFMLVLGAFIYDGYPGARGVWAGFNRNHSLS